MNANIFIKTWEGDLAWLPLCILSIQKYASGFDSTIVVSDSSCVATVLKMLRGTGVTVEAVNDWDNGYIQQQWVKLTADTYTNADYTLFVDSDCIFHTPFTPESFMRDGKPVLLKTQYGDLGGAEAWKAITENFVGFPVHYEYMRRLPWMYRNESLFNFRQKYPNTLSHLKSLTSRDFSEFNALGAYIDKYENDAYYISDTAVWLPEPVAKQYWSWGGITPEIQAEINSFLGRV